MSHVAIDIGITNPGISWATPSHPTRELKHVTDFLVHDMTQLLHNRVPLKECKLFHSRQMCDRVDHLIQEYQPIFDAAERIYIEQQPPFGHRCVEQLLYKRFRDKARLVSPRSMHAFLGISHSNYDQRKEFTMEYAKRFLSGNVLERYLALERKHDVSDSICVLEYGLLLDCKEDKERQAQQARAQQALALDSLTCVDPIKFFDQFQWLDKPKAKTKQSSPSPFALVPQPSPLILPKKRKERDSPASPLPTPNKKTKLHLDSFFEQFRHLSK